eukprot:TRINITY_DN3650_c0_g1_i1.p1 TRINITY_DN3650_c0_g1~~TRINITY_DN3650_c0_g1_i1.p1  ORF type:complete len:754 (+),score=77.43 TRINITY_DN3650_c0_g1_i1:36-2297(+)
MNAPSVVLSLETLSLHSASKRILYDICVPFIVGLQQLSRSERSSKSFLKFRKQLIKWSKNLPQDLLQRIVDRISYLSPPAGAFASVALSHRIDSIESHDHAKLYLNPDAQVILFNNFGASLRHLRLHLPHIDDSLFLGLASSECAGHLKTLKLNTTAMQTTKLSGRLLSAFKSLTTIKLQFRHDLTSGKFGRFLKGIRRLKTLDTLALRLPRYDDPALLKMLRKRNLPELISLSLGQPFRMLFSSEVVPIASRLLAWPVERCRQMRQLQIFTLCEQSMPYLMEISKKFPSLERFLKNGIPWEQFQRLAPMLPQLRRISVQDCSALDLLAPFLAKYNPMLEHLDLETSSVFRFSSSLKQLSSLKTLHVSADMIDRHPICSDMLPVSLTDLQVEQPWGRTTTVDISSVSLLLTDLQTLKGHLVTDGEVIARLSHSLPRLEHLALENISLPGSTFSHPNLRTLDVQQTCSSFLQCFPMLDSLRVRSLRVIPAAAPSLRSIFSASESQMTLEHLECFKDSLQRFHLSLGVLVDLAPVARLPLLTDLQLTTTISATLIQAISTLSLLTKLAFSRCPAAEPDVLDVLQHSYLAKLTLDCVSSLRLDIRLHLLPNLRSLKVDGTQVKRLEICDAPLLQKIKLCDVTRPEFCSLKNLPRLLCVDLEDFHLGSLTMDGLVSCRTIRLSSVTIMGRTRVGLLPLLDEFLYDAETSDFDPTVPQKFHANAPAEANFTVTEIPGSEEDDDDDDADDDDDDDDDCS